jgi:hypothetical protein
MTGVHCTAQHRMNMINMTVYCTGPKLKGENRFIGPNGGI